MFPERNPSSPSILILSGAKGDTRRYRTIHLHQQLQLAGLESILSHSTDPKLQALATKASVLILHRAPYDPPIASIIRTVRLNRGLILYDTDDLIFDPSAFEWIDSPDFQDPIRAALYREDMRRHRQTLDTCDAVLASTEYLADRVRAMGKPAWVHRNGASLELVSLSEQARHQRGEPSEKIVLGYASGTPTHNRDFGLIAPALMDFLDAHLNVEIRIIGFLTIGQEWAKYGNRLVRFDSVPWQKLPFWLSCLDINLAPLLWDNPFSQSKSEIKYLEAALVEVPTLASDTGSYSAAIRPDENGLLAGSLLEWRGQLEKLLDPEFRHTLARNAFVDATSSYSPEVRAHQAVELLNGISKFSGRSYNWQEIPVVSADRNQFISNPEIERHPSEIEMGLYTLRSRGPGILLKQIWIYFRRWLARYIPYGWKVRI